MNIEIMTKGELVRKVADILHDLPPDSLESALNHLFNVDSMMVTLQKDGKFLVSEPEPEGDVVVVEKPTTSTQDDDDDMLF